MKNSPLSYLPSLLLVLIFTTQGFSQGNTKPLDDTSSVDAIISAMYEVISGPSGKRDWVRMRNLYLPSVEMVAVTKQKGNVIVVKKIPIEEYITKIGPNLEKLFFFEEEVSRETLESPNLVQVSSKYNIFVGEDKKKLKSGTNAVTLVFIENRWFISSLAWEEDNNIN